MKAIHLTRSEFDKIKKEYERMKQVDRKQIVKAIAEALDQGDLRENAEYAAAKEKQVFIENKISRYEQILAAARIIDESDKKSSTIRIGNQVTLLDENSGETSDYLLTSAVDLNIHDAETISANSEVGRLLVGKRVGDIVEIKIPDGMLRYEILAFQ